LTKDITRQRGGFPDPLYSCTLNILWTRKFISILVPEKQRDCVGGMVYVTVIKYDKEFILVEYPTGQTKKNNLCEIFNELENSGYTLVTSCGGEKECSELVFVFHKEGIVEDEAQSEETDREKNKAEEQ